MSDVDDINPLDTFDCLSNIDSWAAAVGASGVVGAPELWDEIEAVLDGSDTLDAAELFALIRLLESASNQQLTALIKLTERMYQGATYGTARHNVESELGDVVDRASREIGAEDAINLLESALHHARERLAFK